MDIDIDGKAALVTASASGLGRESASTLGGDVRINERNEDCSADAHDEIEAVADGDLISLFGDQYRWWSNGGGPMTPHGVRTRITGTGAFSRTNRSLSVQGDRA